LDQYGSSAFRISGTITTDGLTNVTLHSADVLAWTVNVTDLSNNATTSYTGTGADFVTDVGIFDNSDLPGSLRQGAGRGQGNVYFYQHGTQNLILQESDLFVGNGPRDLFVTTALGTWDDFGNHGGGYFPEVANSPTSVPEPTTFVLGAMGLLGLGFATLRKKYRRV